MGYNLFSRLYASVQLCEPTIERKQNFQKSREIKCDRNSEIQLWLKNHVFWVTFGCRYLYDQLKNKSN